MSEIDIAGATEALAAELPDSYDDGSLAGSDEAMVNDNPATESFTGFDPNNLPEDLQMVYKSMQADYTRKTQDLADVRRYNESLSDMGVDPNDAIQMVSFFQEMQANPQLAVEYLSALQAQGEPETTQGGYAEDYTSDNSYEGLPPELANELNAMREFRDQYMADQEQASIMAELEVEEQQIRVANPHYTDDDLESIYSLAYATGGDLRAAADQYHAIQQRLLGGYLESKQAPLGATPVPTGPSNTPPQQFKSLDEAHKAAMEAIRNAS